jgi:hypothetical protein
LLKLFRLGCGVCGTCCVVWPDRGFTRSIVTFKLFFIFGGL